MAKTSNDEVRMQGHFSNIVFIFFVVFSCRESGEEDRTKAESVDSASEIQYDLDLSDQQLIFSELTGGTQVGNPAVIEQDLTGGTQVGNPIVFEEDDEDSYIKYLAPGSREEVASLLHADRPKFVIIGTDETDLDGTIEEIIVDIEAIALFSHPMPHMGRRPQLVVFPMPDEMKLDLIALTKGKSSILSSIDPVPGDYMGIAIALGEDNSIVISGAEYELHLLLPYLIIEGLYQITSDSSFLLVLDFNAEESVIEFEPRQYYLQPIIHIKTLAKHRQGRFEVLYHKSQRPHSLGMMPPEMMSSPHP